MATFDYLESRDDADELIQEFGRSVQLVRMQRSGPDYEPTLSPVYADTNAVRVEFSRRQLQSGNVQDTDQRWLVAAGPLALAAIDDVKPSDRLGVDGKELPILKCDPMRPAGVTVFFDCWIRF